jgi:hypothetical protein
MSGRTQSIDEVLRRLADAPQHIVALAADATPDQLQTSPAPADAEWSANDVLAHLRSCADVWGGCIEKMVAEDGLTIRAINPTTWIRHTNYHDLALAPSLDAYATQRAGLLALLEPLPTEVWSHSATVTGAGAPLQKTVFSYAERIVRHERPHIRQMKRAIEAMRLMSISS